MDEKALYCPFYTDSPEIVGYMVARLRLRDGMRVLEPAAGDGVFIDAVLSAKPRVNVTAYELNREAVQQLKDKFARRENVEVVESDTLFDQTLSLMSSMGGYFDCVIGNPPYGAWLDYDKRKSLRELYSGFYVRETYSLFLVRCVNLLREGGMLCFIVPDTFLHLHLHTPLRRFLLCNTRIEEIVLIPSHFFPQVNFGYAGLCIVTLRKSSNAQENTSHFIKVYSGLSSPKEIAKLSAEDEAVSCREELLRQGDVFSTPRYTFLLNTDDSAKQLLKTTHCTIGDIADCVTGFYSGNDKVFLRVSPENSKDRGGFEVIDPKTINHAYLAAPNLLDGLPDSSQTFIPIVKGGGRKYFKPDAWYVDWSQKSVQHYKSDKKARFQNARYYFRSGVAVPMVRSKRVTASLMEGRIFDQSIVGVFPKDPALTLYLLAFFNSDVCNALLQAINHTANNSANYIKRIPFVPPSELVLRKVTELVQRILNDIKTNGIYRNDDEGVINSLITETYQEAR